MKGRLRAKLRGAGRRDSGVRTNLSGLHCEDVSLGSRRTGESAMALSVSFFLAS